MTVKKSEKCFANVRKEVSCVISALGKLKCIKSMIYDQTQFSKKPCLENQRTFDSNYFRHINALPTAYNTLMGILHFSNKSFLICYRFRETASALREIRKTTVSKNLM